MSKDATYRNLKVYIAIVSVPDQPDNVVAADTRDNAIRAAWMQEQDYDISFEEVKTGSAAFMLREMQGEGKRVEVFCLPVHR